MKKVFSLVLVLSLVVAMTGCEKEDLTPVSSPKTGTHQCYGITKSGTRCKRVVSWPESYCYQHKK